MPADITVTDRCPECDEALGTEPLSGKRVCMQCEMSFTLKELDGVATDGGKRGSIDVDGRSAEVESNRGYKPTRAGWISP